MDTRKVDVAIIGAGTAGLNAVREAEKAGKSWLLIERGAYGTTCARVGCMPSKLLIAAADAAHEARRAGLFGVRVPRVEVDGRAVMARLRHERDRFAGAVVQSTRELPDENRLCGEARFLDANTLEVTPSPGSDDAPTRVTANTTVVATGSSPMLLPVFDAVREQVLTSDTVFEIEDLPGSMAVVGTGSIGLEIGQAFDRLGVKVTFLDNGAHPGPCSDPEVIACIDRTLSDNLDLNMNVDVSDARAQDGGIEITWKTGAGDERAERVRGGARRHRTQTESRRAEPRSDRPRARRQRPPAVEPRDRPVRRRAHLPRRRRRRLHAAAARGRRRRPHQRRQRGALARRQTVTTGAPG